jgi:hypothetical protein
VLDGTAEAVPFKTKPYPSQRTKRYKEPAGRRRSTRGRVYGPTCSM